MLESVRRTPPWFVVGVVSAGLIAGALSLASAAAGGTAVAAPPAPAAPPPPASPDPVEASQSSAAAQNAAAQSAYLIAVAHLGSEAAHSSPAAQAPAGSASAPGGAKSGATSGTKAPSPAPTPTPTFVLLSTSDACTLSVEEVVAVYSGLNIAITDNDATGQGQLLDQVIADLALVADHTQDPTLAQIIAGVGTETTQVQSILLTGDSHPVTARFDAQAGQLALYCDAATS